MGRENFDGLDLFGNPVPKGRGRRGRPAHAWSEENSNKINLLFAVGEDREAAAAALGISMPTLRKHYFSELEHWRVAGLKLRAALLLRLHEEGAKGNVAAIKELFKHLDKGALATLAKEVANRGGAPKAPAKGKKEQQQEAADSYRGKFAPPDGPKLFN